MKIALVIAAQVAASYSFLLNGFSNLFHPVTYVDVLVIGGGSSGMYSAIRLHQHNKSVAVIEISNKTGGHVDTYESGNVSFDVGVLFYHNISVVTNFADYLGVELEKISLTTSNNTHTIDFSTGQIIPQSDIDALGDLTMSFLSYYNIIKSYNLTIGFHLPNPVPSDFTMAWKDFIVKHNLGGLAFSVDLFNQGWKDILNQPALYIMKGFGELLLNSFFSGYELAAKRNQDLFDNAAKIVPVLLESRVIRIRDKTALVKGPSGYRLFKYNKLLFAAPPLPENVPWKEPLFEKFSCGYYWNAVLKADFDAGLYNAGDNPYYLADQPGVLTIIPAAPGLHRVYYGSPTYLSDDQVVASILTTTKQSLAALNITIDLSVPFIRSHAPYHCTVTSQDIADGFYDKLNALQGKNDIWYTGATFQAHDSGSIWLFTENEILPALY